MVHVIYHPGFHKTGTSSLQTWCRTNRRALRGRAGFLLPGALRKEVSVWATRFSNYAEDSDLRLFEACLTERLAEESLADRAALMISDENLLGHMPGRTTAAHYLPRAQTLLNSALKVVRARFGEETRITLFTTVRHADDWAKSLYHHHVTHHGEVCDEAEFTSALAHLGGPQVLAKALAERCDIPLQMGHLERMGKVRHGVAAPLLDLLNVPPGQRRGLEPPPWDNRRKNPDTIVALQALNAKGLDSDAHAAHKARILEANTDD